MNQAKIETTTASRGAVVEPGCPERWSRVPPVRQEVLILIKLHIT